MRRTPRQSFVLTISTLIVAPACRESYPPVQQHDDPSAFNVRPAGSADVSSYGRILNERTDDSQQIYRGKTGCFTATPGEHPGQYDTEPVACPPGMRSALWAHCSGTLMAGDDTATCACFVPGNPPPPPTLMDCPK